MPYIITTYLPGGCLDPIGAGQEPDSHRAVATLGEAHAEVIRLSDQQGYRPFTAAAVVAESGGTIGPLPDGTVLEVEWVESWYDLARRAGFPENHHRAGSPALVAAIAGHEQIIAAFNERQPAS